MLYNVRTTFRETKIGELGSKSKELQRYLFDSNIDDYVLLSTCNRTEIYSTKKLSSDNGFLVENREDALEHLFRVSCGLDSMLIGENEILSQLKCAYSNAVKEGHCSEYLSRFFTSAIKLGSMVRAKTNISLGKTSIASIAVDHVIENENYPKDKILIIGSGMFAKKIANALKNKGVEKIILSNRHFDRAQGLAKEVSGIAVRFDDLHDLLKESSIAFSATSAPHAIITPEKIPCDRNILLVDLAVPYDVSEDVSRMENVKVLHLDFFEKIANYNKKNKEKEILKVEGIINEELERFNFY